MITDSLNTQYTYDAEGRIATAGAWTYSYDGVPVDRFSSTGRDGDGNRVLRSGGGSTGDVYWYAADGSLSTETTVNLNPTNGNPGGNTRYYYLDGHLIVAGPFPNPTSVVLHDQLGSTRVTVDTSGTAHYTNYFPFGGYVNPTTDTLEPRFTGKERDNESGNDYFGARYYASSMGRFLSPDPAGVAFSDVSNPQSWNLYSYVQNNPLNRVDPDGRECVWDDGSFDSKDDPQTGSISGCENAGGTYYDPSTFTAGNGQDWSSAPNAMLAAQVAEGEALAASLPQGPDPNSASGGNSSTNGNTTTVDLWGLNWFSSQVSTGTHPWRDNNPGDIISGPFTGRNGQLGTDGRFAVFPTSGTGSQAMNTLLSEPGYQNLSINAAVAKYAPAFENNTASYQQFLINAVGVSGNTPLSSLSSSQMQTLENAISRYEGYDARGNFSVTTTSVITPP